ncbi:MAG: sulfite exporter TauE/SafE family protein [Paracoccaceae bacterium]
MNLPEGLPPEVFLGILGAFLAGGLVKGVLGFGLPLITMSILPFFAPLDLALAINILVQPVSNLGQLFGSGVARETMRRFWVFVPTLGIGVAAGTAFLSGLSPETLLLCIGAMVMAFSVVQLTGARIAIPARHETAGGAVTGLLAGVAGALTTVNGPLFILYLVGCEVDRTVFRATLAYLFIVSAVFIAGGFASIGILTTERVGIAAVCLAPIFAGMWLGNRMGRRLPQALFRRLVLVALFGIGANFVARGAGFG